MENSVNMENVTNLDTTSKKLDKKVFRSVFWRSLSLQGCFNYERMQAIGYCYAMIPALKKLYPDKEEMAEALQRHIGFFNTSPQMVTFILGSAIAIEEQNATTEGGIDIESVNALKAALMGPLAGIGDSFFWGTIRIIGAGIGTGLAVQGNILGAIIFILMYNIPHYILRTEGLKIGYKSGMNFIQKAYSDGSVEKLTAAAKILGTTVIGAMIASMVKVSTPLVLEFGGATTKIQEMFDSIMPCLLPLLLTFGVYKLVNKGYKTTTIMFVLIAIGIVGVLTGLL